MENLTHYPWLVLAAGFHNAVARFFNGLVAAST
jgi:hypothetical protein